MSPMSPRLLRPRATGFNPKSISGLAAWWDFNDGSTVTVQTGISSVLDKSGNGRTLLQTTTNNQPAWTPNVLNGKYAAVFDGSNDTLSASFTLAQPATVFCVGRWTSPAGGNQLFDGASAGNTMRFFISTNPQCALFAGSQITSSNTTLNAHAVWQTVFSGASSSIGRNGVQIASGNAGTASPGGIYLSMFGNGFSNATASEIAAVLIYSAVLTSSQASAVRAWLGKLYGITVA